MHISIVILINLHILFTESVDLLVKKPDSKHLQEISVTSTLYGVSLLGLFPAGFESKVFLLKWFPAKYTQRCMTCYLIHCGGRKSESESESKKVSTEIWTRNVNLAFRANNNTRLFLYFHIHSYCWHMHMISIVFYPVR